jgi:serine O-acetyltransferase
VPGQTVNRTQANGTTDDARMPDPLGISLQSLLTRVTRLETAGNGQTAERVIRPPEAGVWHGEDFSI